MTIRKIGVLTFCFIIALIGYGLWNLYYIMPAEKAKPLIQTFLYKNYNNKFNIITIEKDYSQDLFKQPIGYKLTLKDTNNITFGNVFIEFNKNKNNWITYGGSDIEKEYELAKSSCKEFSK